MKKSQLENSIKAFDNIESKYENGFNKLLANPLLKTIFISECLSVPFDYLNITFMLNSLLTRLMGIGLLVCVIGYITKKSYNSILIALTFIVLQLGIFLYFDTSFMPSDGINEIDRWFYSHFYGVIILLLILNFNNLKYGDSYVINLAATILIIPLSELVDSKTIHLSKELRAYIPIFYMLLNVALLVRYLLKSKCANTSL